MDVNTKRREEIVFGTPVDWKKATGGIKRFNDLTLEKLNQLMELGVVDMESTQNDSPSIGEFRAFIMKNTGFVLTGYVVSPGRTDYNDGNRVNVDGIQFVGKKKMDKATMEAFVKMFHKADEFTLDTGRAWYD
jgi:hypothetical protein